MCRFFILALDVFAYYGCACMRVWSERTVIDECLSECGEFNSASHFIHAAYGLSLLQIEFNQTKKCCCARSTGRYNGLNIFGRIFDTNQSG